MKPTRILASGALALVLGYLAGCQRESANPFHGQPINPPKPAPNFHATNWDGREFSLADQGGKVTLLAFGFTMCPDVCPFTLRTLRSVSEQLGEQADRLSVVFFTVDPERDTREKLGTFIPAFSDRFYGLRLEGDAMASVLSDYRVRVSKHTASTPGGYYAVDHTGDIFVIDPAGQLRLTHPHNTRAEVLAADVRRLLGEP